MRQLKKTKVNVVNAELYAGERRTMYEDGPNWAVCIDVYRPFHSKCKHTYLDLAQTGNQHYTNDDIIRNIETGKRDYSNMGFCSFDFYYRNEYMATYQTAYHLEGKCLQQ